MKHVSRRILALCAVLCAVVLVGCESPPPFVPYPEGITAPRTVAVMPFENQTDSDKGAVFLRNQMQRHLKEKGYVGTPLSDVDQLLSDQFPGEVITDSIQPIGKALGVHAVITGTLHQLGLGSFHEEELEASFAIHETQTGKIIWQYHDSIFRTNIAPFGPDALGRALAEAIMGTPHQELVYDFYRRLLKEMPNGAESSEYEEGY